MSVNEDFNYHIQCNSPDCLSEPKKLHDCVENVSKIGDKLQPETENAGENAQPDLRWPHKLEWSKFRCQAFLDHDIDSMGLSNVDSEGLIGRKFISVRNYVLSDRFISCLPTESVVIS